MDSVLLTLPRNSRKRKLIEIGDDEAEEDYSGQPPLKKRKIKNGKEEIDEDGGMLIFKLQF